MASLPLALAERSSVMGGATAACRAGAASLWYRRAAAVEPGGEPPDAGVLFDLFSDLLLRAFTVT